MSSDSGSRVMAIDAFRAITMVLMLFVNDIPGVSNIPVWLTHADTFEDRLGFSDIVFPAFLFAVGLSVPLALSVRKRKGDGNGVILWHIFERTAALVIMGLLMMNSGYFDPVASGYPKRVYTYMMVAAIFLMWNVYPKPNTKFLQYLIPALKTLGAAMFVFLLVTFHGKDGQPFAPHWWGILGMIGWAYLFCAVPSLWSKNCLWKNFAVWAFYLMLTLLHYTKVIEFRFLGQHLTSICLCASGMLASVWITRPQFARPAGPMPLFGNKAFRTMFGVLCIAGLAMFGAYMICHPHWIISKNLATPTWLFLCISMFFPVIGLLYYICDIRHVTGWFRIIAPAGTATLTCYMIPFLWYRLMGDLGLHYPSLLCSGIPGLLRSFVYALVIVWIAGLIGRIGIKLKI